ncbi:hypothetical protein F4778DRAFT_787117 [Xylariomycetidae sp. FL2044]|nr:hypothetical protein F4778DRAFT_787117 [Xylariomycetidae sp. FL2044]
MWSVLLIRIVTGILLGIYGAFGRNAWGAILGLAVNIISFLFYPVSLTKIGVFEGQVRSLGVTLRRRHFDFFLYSLSVGHVGVLIGLIVGMGAITSVSLWSAMWLLTCQAAWLTPGDPIDDHISEENELI